jgi:hypothetical protein
VKRTGRGDSIGVIIYIYMETTQGNYLSIFISNYKNMFLVLSFMYLFLQNWRTGGRKRFYPGDGQLAPVGRGRWQGKRGRRMNTVQTM